MDKRAKVVIAFLEFMVDQLLPTTFAAADRQASQLSKHHSLPQQVQSLVLLYNYYYRKEQYPLVPFVPFEEFCDLLVSLRPTLSAFMKFTKTSSHDESDDDEVVCEDRLSITEQKIKEACEISKHLDASKESPPSFDEWPITKVAVLLVDYWFEDCFLMFGAATKGTWSLIEQELDDYYDNGAKGVVDGADDEEVLLQIAYSAVKKQAGVCWEDDVMVLESYTAYSHTKLKAATRFYVMKYSCFFKKPNRVPLKALSQSMQGGLVRESDSGTWMLVNSAVDFLPLLPYAELISDWSSCLSRRVYPTQPYRYPATSAALKLAQLEIKDWDAPPCFGPSPPPAAADKEGEMVAVVSINDDIKQHEEEELLMEPPPPPALALALPAVELANDEEDHEIVSEQPAAVLVVPAVELANDDDDKSSEMKKKRKQKKTKKKEEEVSMGSSSSRRVSDRKKTPNKRLDGYKLL